MATFCVLVLPLPFGVRKGMFNFLNQNIIVAKVRTPLAEIFINIVLICILKLAYGLKIAFMLVCLLQ